MKPQGAPMKPQGAPMKPQGAPMKPQGAPMKPQGAPMKPMIKRTPLAALAVFQRGTTWRSRVYLVSDAYEKVTRSATLLKESISSQNDGC